MPAASRPARPPSGAVVKKLAPGQPGTRRLLERYGDALVCVRYRDEERLDGTSRRLTTVELVVDVRPGKAREAYLKIAYGETELRRAIKEAGGTWDAGRRLWRAPLRSIRQLKLEQRIAPDT